MRFRRPAHRAPAPRDAAETESHVPALRRTERLRAGALGQLRHAVLVRDGDGRPRGDRRAACSPSRSGLPVQALRNGADARPGLICGRCVARRPVKVQHLRVLRASSRPVVQLGRPAIRDLRGPSAPASPEGIRPWAIATASARNRRNPSSRRSRSPEPGRRGRAARSFRSARRGRRGLVAVSAPSPNCARGPPHASVPLGTSAWHRRIRVRVTAES